MTIKYICLDCREILNISGFPAVNEVGRKHCDGCGDNEDSLHVINRTEFNIAIKKYILEKD